MTVHPVHLIDVCRRRANRPPTFRRPKQAA